MHIKDNRVLQNHFEIVYNPYQLSHMIHEADFSLKQKVIKKFQNLIFLLT